MNTIKELRQNFGYTQIQLAGETGLALRTIQRLEGSNQVPKGHTLISLSKVFDMSPAQLLDRFATLENHKDDDTTKIGYINLSILSFMVIPFGNFLFPLVLWRRYRSSKFVDEIGRRIINFQIIWWVIMSCLLSVSPLVSRELFGGTQIILYVLFAAYAFNVGVVCLVSVKLKQNNFDFLKLPLRLI